MENQQESRPQIVTFLRPKHHHVLLTSDDGHMLGLNNDGGLALFEDAGDHVIWDRTSEGLKHVASDWGIAAKISNDVCSLTIGSEEADLKICHGPEKLPSEYLEHLHREGWACLNSILTSDVVDRLERVACTGPFEHMEQNTDSPKICQDAAVGSAVAEPISLCILREYLEMRDIHLGHPPGFNVLPPDTLARAGRGWHSDIPYTRSSSPQPVFPRKGPPKACNRNTFVSDFSYLNGATMLKPGSHLIDSAPPEAWNAALENEELPYSGPEATVVEAPRGSMFLYDARTWHRAGYNRSDHKRGMMATNYETADVLPKRDTRPACKKLHLSAAYQELNAREQRDVTDLLMKVPEYIPT